MNLKDCIHIIKNCTMLACEYHIKDKCDYGYEVRENRFECAKEQAIKALEKQIPKEVVVVDYALGETEYRCPSCRLLVSSTYCEECGQKIDWGLDD